MTAPDYSHASNAAVKTCRPLLVIGIGGAGRVAARAGYVASRVIHGADNPHVGLVEIDLCQQDGRDPDPPVLPATPGRLIVHVADPFDGQAVVERLGRDRGHRFWTAFDPDVLKAVPRSDHLGGCAVPSLAHAAFEFSPEPICRLAISVGQLAALIREPHGGWHCTGSLWVFAFSSCAGAVGSSAIHVAEYICRELPQPFRIISGDLLIADKGQVPRRIESLALQHAQLTLIREIARRPPCR
jgi:hypothetical protein